MNKYYFKKEAKEKINAYLLGLSPKQYAFFLSEMEVKAVGQIWFKARIGKALRLIDANAKALSLNRQTPQAAKDFLKENPDIELLSRRQAITRIRVAMQEKSNNQLSIEWNLHHSTVKALRSQSAKIQHKTILSVLSKIQEKQVGLYF